jgi:hypothetical protein
MGTLAIKGAVACENHLSSKFVSEESVAEGVGIFISLITTVPVIYICDVSRTFTRAQKVQQYKVVNIRIKAER